MKMRGFLEAIGREMERDVEPQVRTLERAFIDNVQMLAEVTDEQFEKMRIPIGLVMMIRKRLE